MPLKLLLVISNLMEPFVLRTSDLVLSVPELSDVDAITAACQDPDIQRYTTVPNPYGTHDAEEFVTKYSAREWSEGGAVWAIRQELAGETVLIGMIGLHAYDDKTTKEIGYWVVPAYRERGFITQAVSAVVRSGFEDLGLRRIVWRAVVGNWGSWKPAWTNGFVREGTARSGGIHGSTYDDMWLASLLVDDPQTPHGPWDGPGSPVGPPPNPRDPEALVRQFHTVYNLPIVTGATVDNDRIRMRMRLILEEVCELVGAVYGSSSREYLEKSLLKAVALDDDTRDVVESADALADIIYVVYGMALECGIDLPQVLAEVQASNMSKLGEDGKPIYREDGKVLKGPGFFPPNIRRALGLR